MDGTPKASKASKAYASTCLVGEHFATPAGLPMEVHGVGRMRDSAASRNRVPMEPEMSTEWGPEPP